MHLSQHNACYVCVGGRFCFVKFTWLAFAAKCCVPMIAPPLHRVACLPLDNQVDTKFALELTLISSRVALFRTQVCRRSNLAHPWGLEEVSKGKGSSQ